MYKKKLLTLMVASLLPFSAVINAEEAAGEGGGMAQSEAGETAEVVQAASAELAPIVSAETLAAEVAAEAEPAVDQSESMAAETPQSEAAGGDQAAEAAAEAATPSEPVAEAEAAQESAYAQRWQERESRYQELRSRAEEAGVMLPANPPWHMSQMEANRPSMDERRQQHEKMMNMTPEERDAYRQERYQKMREQAQQQGIEMPEMPPWVARKKAMEEEWAKHQAVIEGMTDEERAACHAMHKRHMGHGMGRGHGMGPGQGNACGHGCQGGYGNPAGMPAPAPRYPGYGYGPAPYGQGNFWDPSY
ncbi:MAG: hypothetical protein JAY72_06155 [Candidatus Thiodiazotropha endolucinida]|nr:hypothetical protein [Candidatus Thiodiazotropha taylori]MCW4321242.1 hypothetical protein [Candidatus Thiodiazotropha taylori]